MFFKIQSSSSYKLKTTDHMIFRVSTPLYSAFGIQDDRIPCHATRDENLRVRPMQLKTTSTM
ncbi:hypothetical protein GN244_ATG11197 [Phytophthora infestans]|uniref:Uncharacterized protein n=1 Tax=Phytophthora infestans TaxID=4787 RepID=A0A833SR90_PHYIN|nr:hypothetical protein GN244_ATG11197 [Phytophthora infestans]